MNENQYRQKESARKDSLKNGSGHGFIEGTPFKDTPENRSWLAEQRHPGMAKKKKMVKENLEKYGATID